VVGLLVGLFELFLEPGTLGGILNMHVFNADGPAVGVSEYPEDFAQQHGRFVSKAAGDKFPIQVPEGEAVAFDF